MINDERVYRLKEFARRLLNVDSGFWVNEYEVIWIPGAVRLLSWIEGWCLGRLLRAGWRPVDFRAGYKVPDHEIVKWEAQLDPATQFVSRMNRAMQAFRNPPTSQGRLGDCRCDSTTGSRGESGPAGPGAGGR